MEPKDKIQPQEQISIASLASNMKRLRKARKWSQSDLAERIGVHLTHVSRVETGKYIPALDFAIKVAQAFGISVDALLCEQADGFQDVRIEDKNLAERLRLLESLDKNERNALMTVIDAMLTKNRIRQMLVEKPVHGEG